MKNSSSDVRVNYSTPTFTTSNGVFATGMTLNSSSGYVTTTECPAYTVGNSNYNVGISNPLPTYDDFWKFNEEFDLLWKSFFENNAVFKPVKEKTVNHPCDIQETDNGLRIELTAVGLDQDDIEIIIDSETLRVSHRKVKETKENDDYRYLHRSIKRASFDIAWKISSKYNLSEMEANLEKGLLIIDIPFAKENKPTKVKINIKNK